MAITKIQSESLNLADDFAFTGTITGAGQSNTPAFNVVLSSTQVISSATITKIQLNNVIVDTDNCYDNTTNYRYTPTTAGKYLVYGIFTAYGGGSSTISYHVGYIRKNGTDIIAANQDPRGNTGRWFASPMQTMVEMNGTTDYLEMYGMVGSTATVSVYGDDTYSVFGAYKLTD